MELMKKKKLTIKDKKFLAKLQKGGRTWGEWFSSFSSSGPAAAAPEGQNQEAVAVSGSDDHSDINAKLASLEEKVCKVCAKTGADCGCAGGPVAETDGEEGPPVQEGEQDAMAQQDGEGAMAPQDGEGAMAQEGRPQSGGRRSKKNKRRRHRKSAKKMSNSLY